MEDPHRQGPEGPQLTTGGATPARLWGAVAVLAVWNVGTHGVGSPVASALFAIFGLVGLATIARAAELGAAGVALERRRIPAGLRWGGGAATVIIVGVLATAVIPFGREVLADGRFADVGTGEMLGAILLTIPIATALTEEVAFRGIILGLLMAHTRSIRTAVVVSSTLFGLWHVLPAIASLETAGVTGAFASTAAVTGQVAVTGLAGAVFAWLRIGSGSLAAPVLAHWALNGSAYLAGWLIVSRGWS